MHIDDLRDKKIVIWGTGREGQASAQFVHHFFPDQNITFVDENTRINEKDVVTSHIDNILYNSDVIIKSPGVSYYHPYIIEAQKRDIVVTSLLNLWFSIDRSAKAICVTGTKGKSTTSSLIAHLLNKMGYKAALAGNIGKALDVSMARDNDFVVIETSSYQATDFKHLCDVAALTSLYPAHIKWHGSLEQYYRDKTSLLEHAKKAVVQEQTVTVLKDLNIDIDQLNVIENNDFEGLNDYLNRPHNVLNVNTAVAVLKALKLNTNNTVELLQDFGGLPHRQQELGTKDGLLFVDDSIATTPQSTMAALEAYANSKICVIIGGQNQGANFDGLIQYIAQSDDIMPICLGELGPALYESLNEAGHENVYIVNSMYDAIGLAKEKMPDNGVVILSPGAPSFDMYESFVARGLDFAKEAGF